MTNDPLHDLIRSADASVTPPRLVSDLASKAPALARRRRTLRIALAAVGCLLMSLSFFPRRHADPALTAVKLQHSQQEVARLDVQARSHERLAELLWERERLQRKSPRGRSSRPDPRLLQRELDQAAYAMVYQADRLSSEPNLQLAAADFYQQVVSDFPESSWASVARQRLARLHDRKEG